jgi:ADP-ribose pyrophosphatase YjhB (NUDIX family)
MTQYKKFRGVSQIFLPLSTMAKKAPIPSSYKNLLDKGDKLYHPGISVDCTIFGFHENVLKVLLLKVKQVNKWALPGGFIFKNETIENAAYRVLQERTGVKNIFLQQFNAFGEPNRSDSSIHQTRYMDYGVKIPKDNWLLQRFITIGFYALIDFTEVNIEDAESNEGATWIDINKLDNLMMDHENIVLKALEALRTQLAYLPIGRNLLPKKFTMPELQKLYETILGQQLDRRNFQRKMIGFGILNKLTETRKGGAHKAPFLYTFNDKKYQKALKEGLYGSW